MSGLRGGGEIGKTGRTGQQPVSDREQQAPIRHARQRVGARGRSRLESAEIAVSLPPTRPNRLAASLAALRAHVVLEPATMILLETMRRSVSLSLRLPPAHFARRAQAMRKWHLRSCSS